MRLLLPTAFAALVFSTGALAADPTDPAALPPAQGPVAAQARTLFEKGDYRGAEKLYEEMLAVAPDNLNVLSNLGAVRFRSGKYKKAEEVLRQAVVVGPNDAFCHFMLGLICHSDGRAEEALRSFERTVQLDPKNAAAHRFLGELYALKNMPAEATKAYEKARELEPEPIKRPNMPRDFPSPPQNKAA